jgi:hypothetical protein
MTSQAKRPRQALATIVWLGLTVLLGNIALMAWSRSNYYLCDPTFAFRFQQLHKRLCSTDASKSTIVLLLGSSRTLNLFDARVIEASLQDDQKSPFLVHNFGLPGAGAVMHYATLSRVLEAGIRPDWVLVEYSPCFHYGPADDFKDAWLHGHDLLEREERELAPFGWAGTPQTFWSRVAPTWFKAREFLSRRVRPEWFPSNAEVFPNTDAWGHLPLYHQTPEARARALKRVKEEFTPRVKDWTPAGRTTGALKLLLDRCQKERVSVTLVRPPEGPSMQSWYSADSKKRIQEFLDTLQPIDGRSLIDAWTWLDEEDFEDAHHPNIDGTKKFTDRITKEWLIPRYRGSNHRGPERPFLTTSSKRPS